MSKNLVRESANVESSYDFELSISREDDVLYHYTYPKDKKLNGIVFIIAGFGEDTNSEYSKKLRDFIAEKFNVVAVSVIYHCFYSRFSNGATTTMDDTDKNIFISHLRHFKYTMKTPSIHESLEDINKIIIRLKDEGKIDKSMAYFQTMTILPKNDEYQNFGVLQALDHINVLQDIKKKNLDFIDDYPTVMLGSSHGAYIAYLASKFAPTQIDCVIDNSSYVKPPLNYIVGKETDPSKAEFIDIVGNFIINYFVKTYWTTDEKSVNYFSPDNYEIRNLLNEKHNKKLADYSDSKTKFISYHSTKDMIAPIDNKKTFYKQLEDLGFDTTLKIISDESQVDGKFIKNLGHGMDMSLKRLAEIELPNVLKIRNKHAYEEVMPITYKCEKLNYNFENIDGVYSANLSPVDSVEELIKETFSKNMEYFEKKQPDIYSKLAAFDSAIEQSAYEHKYDLVMNNNYFDVKEFSTGNYLYGDNSKKLASEAAKKFTKNMERFIFFGVGLGIHVEEINIKVKAKKYLIVEDDLELFKLSTLVTPYYEMAKNASLYFSVFEQEEEFSKIVKEFLRGMKKKGDSVGNFEINSNYKNKVLIIDNTIGS